jgi:hypothetical protein
LEIYKNGHKNGRLKHNPATILVHHNWSNEKKNRSAPRVDVARGILLNFKEAVSPSSLALYWLVS